jgi:HEAT repeat protein
LSYDFEDPTAVAIEAGRNGDVDVLLALLVDPNMRAREMAAHELGRLRSTRAVPSLVRCLRARGEGLRLSALWALARIADDSAAQDVFEVATGEASFLVRSAAVSTLVALGDRRAGAVVMSMFDDPARAEARRFGKWSLEILLASGTTDAIPLLREQERKSDFLQRRRIRRAISALERARERASGNA